MSTSDPGPELPGFGILLAVALATFVQRYVNEGGWIHTRLNRLIIDRLGGVPAGGRTLADLGRGLAKTIQSTPDADVAKEPLAEPPPPNPAVVQEPADRGVADQRKEPADKEERRERLDEFVKGTKVSAAMEAEKVRRYESLDFIVIRSTFIAGMVTLVLAIVGVVLVAIGYLPLGLVSAAVAIIPGAGTVGLRMVSDLIKQRLDGAQSAHKESQATLRSVEATRAVGDEELRDAELVKLARRYASSSVAEDDNAG